MGVSDRGEPLRTETHESQHAGGQHGQSRAPWRNPELNDGDEGKRGDEHGGIPKPHVGEDLDYHTSILHKRRRELQLVLHSHQKRDERGMNRARFEERHECPPGPTRSGVRDGLAGPRHFGGRKSHHGGAIGSAP
jgi:hypothetical protein